MIGDEIYIFDDVIDNDYQNKIKETFFGKNFPWFFVDDISYADNTIQKRPGFSHFFIDDREINSKHHSFILPLITNSLKKINFNHTCLTQGRAFFQLPLKLDDEKQVDTPHIDSFFPHLVVLYYVCDNEADTIIYKNKYKGEGKDKPNINDLIIEKKIKPKQGRVVMFNGYRWHTAEQPKETQRCVINYNAI